MGGCIGSTVVYVSLSFVAYMVFVSLAVTCSESIFLRNVLFSAIQIVYSVSTVCS